MVGAKNVCNVLRYKRVQVIIRKQVGILILSGSSEGDGGGSEFADTGADGGEAVAAGGGEIAQKPEFIKKRGFGCGDLGGRGAGIGCAEEMDETFHQWGIGVDAKSERSVELEFADQPDGRLAAVDPMALDPFGGEKRRDAPSLLNDDSEAFLAVRDDEQVVDQALVPLGKRHGDTTVQILENTSRRRVARNVGPASPTTPH